MRFPELSLTLAKMGADILTFPSAFTFATGAAHWETLLRARAIESQCYVVAAAQTGTHNSKRSSWGHAMVGKRHLSKIKVK
jgi:predicted amidohydrolase